MDTKFSVAVHVLILISESPTPINSDQMAISVGTNASYVRKILALLKKAGIVDGHRGISGCTLLIPPEQLTLLQIYQAVTEDQKASSAIPFVCKPYTVGGTAYYDGALSDPVPLEKAFQLGSDRVVLILTKPEQMLRSPKKDEKLAACIRHAHPAAAEKLCLRAQRYNENVALARMRTRQGKVLIVAPEDTCGVDTLTKDKQALRRLYQMGYADAQKITDFLRKGEG